MSMIALLAAAATAAAPQVRFCPAGFWAYPLDDQRGNESLVLQSVALVNEAGPPLTVTGVEIDLLNGGQVRDSRTFAGAEAAALAKAAPRIEAFRSIIP